MARWGMVIDLDRCTACGACVISCKAENNIPTASPEEAKKGGSYYWMEMLPMGEGEFPHPKFQFIPRPCMHCDRPACIKVCPVRATYKNEEGIVAQIFARCIGCRYCTVACPYTVRVFNWFAPSWPESLKNQLNPDVSIRPKGVVEKCIFCHHRLRKVKERARRENRPVRDEEVVHLPACAESCPAKAISFGDLDNQDSTVSKLARLHRAFRLQEDVGTHPKVIYLREE